MAEAVSGSGAVSAVISVDENRGGSTSATTVQRQVDQPSTSQPGESCERERERGLRWRRNVVEVRAVSQQAKGTRTDGISCFLLFSRLQRAFG